MNITQRTVFETEDGQQFETIQHAQAHVDRVRLCEDLKEYLDNFADSLDDNTREERYLTEKGAFDEFIPGLIAYMAEHPFEDRLEDEDGN